MRCFVAVAEELNFRRAAERLNMTQPPLSRQIRLLEHAMGVTLFDRSKRQVMLTPAGANLLVSATEILQRAEFALLSARQAERGELGAVTMGFVPSAGVGFVPDIAAALTREMPDVRFRPAEMMSYEIVEALISGQLDLGLTRSPGRRGELNAQLAVSEPFVLALPAGHRLLTRDEITLFDLDSTDFIAYSSERGGALRKIQDALFANEGISPRIRFELSQTHSILHFVNRGLGIALVPRSSMQLSLDGLRYRPIAIGDRFRSKIYLCSGPKTPSVLLARVVEVMMRALTHPNGHLWSDPPE
ncbi:LysR substrate-binding domain-containing protein (plasmid) [Thioclava sp. 'Guangxiensis']|uniref:LysR substrate-binding domain-containing protein n=1 Tax=Thioclava sp. 'Guangxiensis' TaxID=3149044 RepID=UPI0032C46AEE